MGAIMTLKTAVIFGAGGGIGSAICEALLKQGTRVVGVGHHREPLRMFDRYGPQFLALEGDATSEESVQAVLETAQKELNRVEGVAYCIGSILLKPAHLTTLAEFQQTLSLNLTGAFLVLKHAAPLMSEQGGGSILFFSSAAAGLGLPNHEAIAAAKSGLEGMVRAAAMTYAKKHVRVNAIAPGLVDTPLSKMITSQEASLKASTSYHPLGRIGKPSDLVEAALWALGGGSSWMTGSVLSIDGGMRNGRL
jgi:NAD(P)-dependent dehydrogenase (short-subunit alcohol dehydrogenase family)